MTVVVVVILFALAFPALWMAVGLLVSAAGWGRLARRYATDLPASGHTFRGVSGRVGVASYSGVLTVSVDPEGLRLAVMPLFRAGHPPVLIPWADILDVRARTTLWHTAYALDTAASVTVVLPERVVAAVREAAPALRSTPPSV